MIKSFKDKDTERLFQGQFVSRYPRDILRTMLRKLVLVHAATTREDLRVPPGNHLEELKGDLSGYSSIRINLQWRITFKWIDGNAYEVQIIDYH